MKTKTTTLLGMIGYSTGDIAISLTMNTYSTFAMLYYTGSVGLSAVYAGLAMSISIFWDAITDPVMGYISDNTKSKYGRRHIYILIGGLALAGIFFLIWYIPPVFRTSQMMMFVYLLVINLLFRTALTVFSVPSVALGFELTTDYNQRTLLQSIRAVANMCANFAGPGLAWSIFFATKADVQNKTNFVHMGIIFSIVIGIAVLAMYFLTLKAKITGYEEEHASTEEKTSLKSAMANVFKEMKDTVVDKNGFWLLLFGIVSILAIITYATVQIYIYQYYMGFDGHTKTIVNGGTMIASFVGSLAAYQVVKGIDKKGTIYAGCLICIGSCITTMILVQLNILHMNDTVSTILFAILNIVFWFGWGMTGPAYTSMFADAAEVSALTTGKNQDGIYSAMQSFVTKAGISISSLLVGFALSGIGFKSGVDSQSPHTQYGLAIICFIFPVLILIVVMIILKRYPLTKSKLEEIRSTHKAPVSE